MITLVLVLPTLSCPLSAAEQAADDAKPRLVVLTDIGGDPDDQQSMIRLMLYANEFEIEGLIASAAGTPGELKEAVTKPHLIREIVDAYGKVRGNLARHASGFPDAERLMDRIKSGNPQRGLEAIGEGHDTEGSRWIVKVVDKDDPRPVNITIWGGQTDLAQALWRVRQDRGEQGLREFIGKLRVYDIANQDGIAAWIWSEFPGLFYVLSKAPEGQDKREAALRGMYLGGDESLVSREWMQTHIRRDHGPLGGLYPSRTWTAPNPHSAIKEGDTPSWFFFLPTGLSDPEHPDWGSWGGRFEKHEDGIWRDAKDTIGESTHARATVWRWRPAYQADFQARLDWCVTDDFTEANHNPVAVLNGDSSRTVLHLSAKPGETVRLTAEGSRDPDDDDVHARWFVYEEAGTSLDRINLSDAKGLTTSFTAARVARPQTIHVILEVRDDGTPSLSRFRRAVVRVTGR
ncbi:MAG: nucleoside hydrolase-like domain-containing protein [Planctomycetaceae bacterium]